MLIALKSRDWTRIRLFQVRVLLGSPLFRRRIENFVRRYNAERLHLVRFPSLSINHAALIYAARRVGDEIEFKTYDPNTPQAPATIRYRPNEGVFTMATNAYFPGGRIDLYQVYHSIFY